MNPQEREVYEMSQRVKLSAEIEAAAGPLGLDAIASRANEWLVGNDDSYCGSLHYVPRTKTWKISETARQGRLKKHLTGTLADLLNYLLSH
jgi:hypothetical protein